MFAVNNNLKTKVPTLVWTLGFSMLFMNISSVLVYICMPFFLTYSLKLDSSTAGAIEGAVEGFSLIIRTVTGALSDFCEKRKNFIIVGYIFCLLSRLFLSIANIFDSAVYFIISSRFLDKFSNAVQAVPREAIISDNTPPELIGNAYGINKMLGFVGSAIGSVLALIIFMYTDKPNFYNIFWIASSLILMAVFLVHFSVKEKKSSVIKPVIKQNKTLKQISIEIIHDVKKFSTEYWKVVLVGFLFKLGYFSGSYMMLLVEKQNFASFEYLAFLQLDKKPYLSGPIVMLIQNVMSSLFSIPLGNISDKLDRRKSVAIGLISLLLSLLCFGFFSNNPFFIFLGIVFYGLQFAMQGCLLALLTNTMPKNLHGTGFGMFYTITGISVILTNVYIMSPIWKNYSPEAAFITICIPIVLSLMLLCNIKKSNISE